MTQNIQGKFKYAQKLARKQKRKDHRMQGQKCMT